MRAVLCTAASASIAHSPSRPLRLRRVSCLQVASYGTSKRSLTAARFEARTLFSMSVHRTRRRWLMAQPLSDSACCVRRRTTTTAHATAVSAAGCWCSCVPPVLQQGSGSSVCSKHLRQHKSLRYSRRTRAPQYRVCHLRAGFQRSACSQALVKHCKSQRAWQSRHRSSSRSSSRCCASCVKPAPNSLDLQWVHVVTCPRVAHLLVAAHLRPKYAVGLQCASASLLQRHMIALAKVWTSQAQSA